MTPAGQASYYSYYAGYTSDFAKSMVTYLDPVNGKPVLDPWNGAGTTTAACAELGCAAIGSDLNPVMVVVAKGRLLSARTTPSIHALARKIVATAQEELDPSNDPLAIWFSDEGVRALRRLERSTNNALVGSLACPASPQDWSDLACFFYIGLFNVVRACLKPFRTSNPTWVKRPRHKNSKIDLTFSQVSDLFILEMCSLSASLAESAVGMSEHGNSIEVKMASSTALALSDKSIGAVLTSPPYCTRIDYAIATAGELSVLGAAAGNDFDAVRRSLMGSSTVNAVAEEALPWGDTCLKFLDDMWNHQSKASQTYYYRSHCQYFEALFKSIGEIGRVLDVKGRCALVVQNSYYKEILNDLPQICIEMGESQGLKFIDGLEFYVRSSMARQNPRAMKYSPSRREAEEVLVFERTDCQ